VIPLDTSASASKNTLSTRCSTPNATPTGPAGSENHALLSPVIEALKSS
jgi:hypothetical protein